MKQRNVVLALFLAAHLSAPHESLAQTQKPAKPETQPSTAEIEQKLRALETRVRSLQGRVSYRFASLDCNTGKYDEFLFKESNLVFFARCAKIETYLEGHRITVTIGNPYTFNFSNVNGTLSYGTDWADASDKKVEVSVTDTFRSGSWNTITVIVNPSKPEDMRYLSLELNAQNAGPTR